MGTKYTTQTISGYNSSPPSDDASVNAANQVTWAKHKTKLGDPIKTLAEAMNTLRPSRRTSAIRSRTSSRSSASYGTANSSPVDRTVIIATYRIRVFSVVIIMEPIVQESTTMARGNYCEPLRSRNVIQDR